jgi:hypothetical protein
MSGRKIRALRRLYFAILGCRAAGFSDPQLSEYFLRGIKGDAEQIRLEEVETIHRVNVSGD